MAFDTRRSTVSSAAVNLSVSDGSSNHVTLPVNIQQERNNNVFLRAIRPGMALHLELDRCRPINAILVPSCQVLDDLRIDESMMSPAFLRAHCLRSLSKGKMAFITVLGAKGEFAPDFNSVTVGSRKLSVLRRMPLDVQAGFAVAEELPDVYIVSELACSLDDVRIEDARTSMRQKSAVNVDDDAPPSSFKEFQVKLQDRKVKHVAKNIKAFLTQQGAPEVSLVPQAVRLFTDTTAEELLKVGDLWGPPQDADRYREEVFEDLERYVMTKLYDRALNAVSSEPAVNEALASRIGLLVPWVSPRCLNIPDSVVASKFWRQAVAAIGKCIDFKVPRDKVVCLMNAITYLSQAVRRVDADVGADVLHPALILCVAHANPRGFNDHLTYIMQFRWKEKLRGEVHYYLSVLQGAVAFWQSCTHRELQLDQKDFEAALSGKAPPPNLHAASQQVAAAALPSSSSGGPPSSPGVSNGAVVNNNTAGQPAPTTLKKVVPMGRIAIVDDEEHRRRETWDTSFGSRNTELQAKWQVDSVNQKSAEEEINVSLSQIDRQLDHELQMLRSALKAEEAVEKSRLQSWHSTLTQLEAGLAQTQGYLVTTQKRVNEFVVTQSCVIEDLAAARRLELRDMAAEHDRRMAHAEESLRDLHKRLEERAKQIADEQRAIDAAARTHRDNAARDRQALNTQLDQREAAIEKRERDFKAYMLQEQESLSQRVTAQEAREAAHTTHVRSVREELAQLEEALKTAQASHEELVAQRTAELDAREEDLKARDAELAARLEGSKKEIETARQVVDTLGNHHVAQLKQRSSELDDQDKKVALRATETDRLSRGSQEAHARREADLNRRTSELETSLETSRATIARRAADLARQTQANQEQLSLGMQEVSKLRAEVHQRMTEDRATILGVQSNLDERHNALVKREAELQSRLKEVQEEAKAQVLAAKQAQRATVAECAVLCREGAARIDSSDFLGQVSGYDNLKISDLQNLWKTMDALRTLKTDFQSKTGSLTQMAAALPE